MTPKPLPFTPRVLADGMSSRSMVRCDRRRQRKRKQKCKCMCGGHSEHVWQNLFATAADVICTRVEFASAEQDDRTAKQINSCRNLIRRRRRRLDRASYWQLLPGRPYSPQLAFIVVSRAAVEIESTELGLSFAPLSPLVSLTACTSISQWWRSAHACVDCTASGTLTSVDCSNCSTSSNRRRISCCRCCGCPDVMPAVSDHTVDGR